MSRKTIFLNLSVFIIFLFIVFTAIILSKNGITDGATTLYLPLSVGIMIWIVLAMIGMIPSWTVIVGILFTSAIIGFKVWNGSSGQTI